MATCETCKTDHGMTWNGPVGLCDECGRGIDYCATADRLIPMQSWTCPSCAFSFAAVHQSEDGSYSCPNCEESRLRAALSRVTAERDALLGLLGDREAIWSVLYDVFPSRTDHDGNALPFYEAADALRAEAERRVKEVSDA